MRQRIPLRTLTGAALLLAVIGLAAGAPWLATHDPRATVTKDQLQPPSRAHVLGTDLLGRDVFSRVLYGGRRVLGGAVLALVITVLPGLAVGAAAGYAGRWVDGTLMTLVDALLAFPGLLLALALVTLFGRGPAAVAAAVGVAGFPAYARVVRAAVLSARGAPHVEAARAIGAGPWGIVGRHVLPQAAPALLTFAGVSFSWAVLNTAALAFLGVSGEVGAPDWGVMLADGRAAFRLAPWAVIAPGAAISLVVLAVNTLARR